MATLTNEQIEAKKLQLKQLAEEAKKLKDELVEAGAWPLEEDELGDVAGGSRILHRYTKPHEKQSSLWQH